MNPNESSCNERFAIVSREGIREDLAPRVSSNVA